MLPTIWTRCGGPTNQRELEVEGFRVVEGQHVNSTRKLVDSDAEQRVVEELIDGAKPPRPKGDDFEGLHFLLYTPFRHPPLKGGTRFGTRTERGVFYAARELETALAEWAYYRFVFLEGSLAELGTIISPTTTFKAAISTKKAIDLTQAPFAELKEQLASPCSYADSQALGREMRADGIEAVAFFSSRRREGVNYALFEPCFGDDRPLSLESWSCRFNRELVEFKKHNVFEDVLMSFERVSFEVGGVLPMPAVE
jgi:hypothetical protein